MTNEQKLIAALMKQFGQVKTTGNGWIRIPCPTCNEKNKKKFKRYVSATSRFSNCFICGRHVDIQDLLGGHYMPTFDPNEPRQHVEKKVDPRAFELPCTKYTPINQLPLDHPAIKFLHKDHLFDLDRYWENYGIMYVPYDGGKVFLSCKPYTTSSERIIFPVFFQHNFVGWQMRSVPGTFFGNREDVIRYYHIFDKGSYLYNYDWAKMHKDVVVVEGAKKALKFPNGVATWGTGISVRQVQLIQEWDRIAIMLDAEDHNNTQKRAIELVDGLRAVGKEAINIDLRRYQAISPDDLPSDVLQGIVKEEWHEQRGL
jgi:hypothetical protein